MKKLFIIVLCIAMSVPAFCEISSNQKGKMTIDMEMVDPGGTDTVTKTVTLKYIKASEIEPFIKARLSTYGAVQTNDPLNMLIITDKENKVLDLIAVVKQLDVEKLKNFMRLETEVIQVKNLRAGEIAGLIGERLSSSASIKVSDNMNTIIITDFASKIEQAKELIAKLDVPAKQVMIEARIVELNNTDDSKIGLDWRQFLNSFRMTAQTGASNMEQTGRITYDRENITERQVDYNVSINGLGPSSASISFGMDGIDKFLGIMIKDGKAKMVSSPRVVAVNNRQANINTGDRIYYNRFYSKGINQSSPISPRVNSSISTEDNSYYYSQSQVQVYQDGNSAYYNSNMNLDERYIDTGVTMYVTPGVISDSMVKLDIYASISNLVSWSPDGNPIIANKSASSTVTIKDGETFVIGGLKSQDTVKITDRVPVLGYIPVLDLFFASTKETKVEKDVVIFISPVILQETGVNKEEAKK